jgi:hypothetical protein
MRVDYTVKMQAIMFIALVALTLSPIIADVSAAPNVGMLRVASFECPREVAPGSAFPVSLDVEYAVQGLPNNATIRGAIYPGNINSTSPLWQSDPASVSNGGDQVWNVSLTAPSTEGFLNLTAYALFLENGTWKFFSDPVSGPGVSQATIKIGKSADLTINLGAPNADVTIDGSTLETSASGDASLEVAVGTSPLVSVPPIVEFQNSTRIVFVQWSDGVTQPQRHVLIDGDVTLRASYKTQYLLKVNSGSASEIWYDNGSNATLTAPPSGAGPWPLNLFGVTQSFTGWTGDIQSPMRRLNIKMDSPKTVTAEISVDYRPLAVPIIVGVGTVVAIISLVLIQRKSTNTLPPAEEAVQEVVHEPSSACPNCGLEIEGEWTHCIKCGTKLTDTKETDR